MSKKIVLITGTNSGFGWLAAKSVAALGHKVYATMRDTSRRNAEKAKELSQVENISVLDVTLTDEKSVNQAFDNMINKEGRIDVLVNNAGYLASGVVESFTTGDVQDMFDVHVLAYWRLMKHSLPSMRQQGEGLIVNISSTLGRVTFPFAAVYSAAKFAIEGLSEGLSYEVKHFGIDVALIEPGSYPTDIIGKMTTGSDTGVNEAYARIMHIPEQMGAGMAQLFEQLKPNPQDVADTIVNLINLPKGKRPLRTVVDPVNGKYATAVNAAIKPEQDQMMTAFGMAELLS